MKVNTEFLIEQAPREPLATVKVVSRNGTNGTGIILRRHLPGPIEATHKCFIYGDIDPRFIVKLGAFAIDKYGRGNVAVDRTEHALTDSFPVILEEPSTPTHFVVAHGWEPAFVSGSAARGTYRVRDPGFGVQRLVEDRYDNKFCAARGLRRMNSAGVPAPATGIEQADESLTIGINGPAHAYITDPLGREIRLDEELGEYVTSIPDAVMERQLAVDDHEDPATGGEPIDLISLRNAVAGEYTVSVQGEADGLVWVSGSAYHGGSAEAHDDTSNVLSAGLQAQYRLTYVPGSTPVVDFEFVETTDVPRVVVPEPLTLRLVSNPARGRMTLIYSVPSGAPAVLEFFDVSGRRVRTIQLTDVSQGVRWASWDGRDDGGRARPSGVYLVRLRAGDDVRNLRGVLLR